MSEKKQPDVRFKGFYGDWGQNDLEDKVTFYSGLTYSPSNVVKDGGTLVLRSSNVKNGEIVNADNVYVNTDVVNSQNVAVGDIVVVVRNGSRSLIGKHAQIKSKMDNTVIGAFMTGLHSTQPGFINALLDTNQFSKEIEKNLGATINQITTGAFRKMSFFFADDENEQAQISEFFKNIDNLIALNQSKYDKLISMKKACLEKMFPKDGADTPEIRFKGFSEKWERYGFSDLTFLSGEKNKENLPYESYSISNERGFVPQNEQFENGGTMRDANKSMYLIVSPKSFAYNPARINVGSIGYYDSSDNVIVSSLYEVFKTTEKINDRFLWHWFKSDLFQKKIEQFQEGGVRLYFYYAKLCLCDILIPNIKEQTEIGNYMDNLDNLINLSKTELEKLKNIKKALLEKMFI